MLSPLPPDRLDDRALRPDDALELSLAAAASSACAPRCREVDSRLADILWYVLLAVLGAYAAWRIYDFRPCQPDLGAISA